MITTSLELSLLILTIEFFLISVAIAFFSYRSRRSSESKTTAEAAQLVNKVADTEKSRRTALETVFKVKYQYDGDELASMVDEFMQREKAFYNAVVGAFMGRDKAKLSDLNEELTKVVAPWISMTPQNMVDSKEVESLAATNTNLETELTETKKVLEEMIEEYKNTFHVDDPIKSVAPSPQNEPTKEDKTVETEGAVSVAPRDSIDEAIDVA